jgi:lysyl-tRNA synthetase class 2
MSDTPTTSNLTPPTEPTGPSEHEQIAERRAKLGKLRSELGIDPFGHRIDGLVSLEAARAKYDADADAANKADPAAPDRRPTARVAGRVIQHRVMGNLIFANLRDLSGDLQVAISKKAVDEKSFKLTKQLDLGDIISVYGALGTTKTGEKTLWAVPPTDGSSAVILASKALQPPPSKWHGLQDPELRYRQRYVDLWSNPQVMRTMQLRMRIIEEIRQFLKGRGYQEVETPMLQPIHGGAAARPFQTHHNALDMPLYLRIAPELYLKRLLVGGFNKVFEINRNFRNEGISPRHNPEFTMLEAYEAFGSWETMADLVEEMVTTVAMKVFGTLVIRHEGTEARRHEGAEAAEAEAGNVVTRTINLARPWRRVSMVDLVAERTGLRFDKQAFTAQQIESLRAANPGKDLKLAGSPAEQLVEVYEKLIEPTLIDPCFVTHVPSVVIPLAKENKDDPFFADVYELAINGVEISPGYSELNDPDVQERHFRHQVGDREEQQQVDEDFLNALRVGMPPAGGMGLGIDRLVMMLTGAPSIRDVILFPLMRPQGKR